jgi:hypothetical protein
VIARNSSFSYKGKARRSNFTYERGADDPGHEASMRSATAKSALGVALPEDPRQYYAGVDDDGCGCDLWIGKFEAEDMFSPHNGTPLQLALIFRVMQNVRTAL